MPKKEYYKSITKQKLISYQKAVDATLGKKIGMGCTCRTTHSNFLLLAAADAAFSQEIKVR